MNNRTEVLENLGNYNGADFSVRRESLLIRNELEEQIDTIDSHVALVREDTNQVLSIVGSKYKPVDHVDAFQTAENVIELSDLDITGITRETRCSHNGARAYSIYTLPEHRVNLGRKNDDVALTISARNSFDGSWSFTVEVGGYRFICLNMQVFANNFAIHKSKHTKGLNLQRVADKLSEAVKFYDQETELWKEMVDTNINNVQAMDVLAHLANSKSAQAHLKAGMDPIGILYAPDVIRNKTLFSLYHYWFQNKKQLDSTAWTLYNSMTEWATHGSVTKKSSIGNYASLQIDRLDKVRKTLNDKMIPELKLVA
jgi:hypothetical protein